MRNSLLTATLTATLCCLPALTMAQESPSAILVLDASGSMWGQIDGTAKITIAQDVIGRLLSTLPPEQRLGLTVYGHRRKGDCSDIETIILPGENTRAAIASAVNGISPKGKTPLSAAVIQAAEALKYTEEAATVILISDGKETCQLNTCEVGRRLEETGVNFTAHVVGFDVADPLDIAQLQCLAENTGGIFRTASNADELAKALEELATVTPVEPTPVLVTLGANEGENGPDITDKVLWRISNKDGDIIDEATPGFSDRIYEYLPGEYHVSALRPRDETWIEQDFTVADENVFVNVIFPEYLLPATIDTVASAPAASSINVNWTGPAQKGDYIAISEVGSGLSGEATYAYIADSTGSTLSVPLPSVIGDYEVRYVMDDHPRKLLTSQPITITEIFATLDAPAQVEAGSSFTVNWTGPNKQDDYIAIDDIGAAAFGEITYAYLKRSNGQAVEIIAPTTPGTYELRYLLNGKPLRIMASKMLEVVEAKASLKAPDTAPAGSKIEVIWSGPANGNNYIAIDDVGSSLSGELTYTYLKRSTGNTLKIDTPTTPGTYELRFIQNGKPLALLAKRTLVVKDVTATLKIPASGMAGQDIQNQWTGPANANDYISINEIGSPVQGELTYRSIRYSKGEIITLQLPKNSGDYEVRYVLNGKNKRILTGEIIRVK